MLTLVPAKGAARMQLWVLDQVCFGLPAPASITDTLAAESLGRYLEMLGRFGQIKSDRVLEIDDRLFSVYEGTIAAGNSTDKLEQRNAEVIAVTRYGKLLFVWCWSAPTLSELVHVPSSPAQFRSGPPITIGPGGFTSRSSSRP